MIDMPSDHLGFMKPTLLAGSLFPTVGLFQRTVPVCESALCRKDSVCSSVSPWLHFPSQGIQLKQTKRSL